MARIVALATVLAFVVGLCWWSYTIGRDNRTDTIEHLTTVNDTLAGDLTECKARVALIAPAPQIEPAANAMEEENPEADGLPTRTDEPVAYNVQITVTQEVPLGEGVALAVRRIYREGERQVAALEVTRAGATETATLSQGETVKVGGLRVQLLKLDATQATLFVVTQEASLG